MNTVQCVISVMWLPCLGRARANPPLSLSLCLCSHTLSMSTAGLAMFTHKNAGALAQRAKGFAFIYFLPSGVRFT
jgi:hypothetical protein